MKKVLLVIPAVIAILVILFFVINFINFTSYSSYYYLTDDAYSPKWAIEFGLFNSNEYNPVTVYLNLWPGEHISPNSLESEYNYSRFDEEIQIFKYEDILDQTLKVNVDFIGDVESYNNKNFIGNEDDDESVFLKGEITCNAEFSFIEELELNQKNCEIEFSKINEETYEENKGNLDVYITDPIDIEIMEKQDYLKQLSQDFSKLGFFDYLFNNALFEEKRTNLINEEVKIVSEVMELMDDPRVNAQEELDEILSFMSDKNMNLIIESRRFNLVDKLDLSTVHPINISKYFGEYVALSGNTIENLKETKLVLRHEIKKENDSFEIEIKRG